MGINLAERQQLVAKSIGGKVVDSDGRVAVCIKATVQGMPATLEAIGPNWPFGVMYMLETQPIIDPNIELEKCKISLYPRIGRGLASILTRLVLFESRSLPVNNRQLENIFNFNYDKPELAAFYVNREGVPKALLALEHKTKFSELIIQSDAGIYLSQPKAFSSLDGKACKEVFDLLADLADALTRNLIDEVE